MLTKFDNIVFDLGGVIVDLRREQCIESFRSLGFKDVDGLLGLYVQNGLFLDLEEGRITPAEFYDGLRMLCDNKRVTDIQLQDAFNSFLIGIPVKRLQALRRLRKKKKLFALSNTNAVMYTSALDELFRVEGLSMRDYFDGIILSFEEKYCKPKPQIFEALLRRYQLDPSRTLFLDDSEVNCEAARGLGIAARQVEPGTEFMDILRKIR